MVTVVDMTGQNASFLLQVSYSCSLFKDKVDAFSLTVTMKSFVNRLIRKCWDCLHSKLHGAALYIDLESGG